MVKITADFSSEQGSPGKNGTASLTWGKKREILFKNFISSKNILQK